MLTLMVLMIFPAAGASSFPDPAAESGRHVHAAAAVAGGASRYRAGRQESVPERNAGDPGP